MERGDYKETELMKNGKVLTVCLSPTFQNTLVYDDFRENEVNRAVGEMNIEVSGKGINVIRVVSQLGRKACCLLQLGGPRVGEYLELCKKGGLSVQPVICDSAIRTCTTIINRKNGTSTELVENAHEVSEQTDRAVRERFVSLLDGCKALIISGTKAPGFGPDIYPWMVNKAKEKGLLVVVDIKGKELESCLQYGPDIIKPNLSEFAYTFFKDTDVPENDSSEHIKKAVMDKAAEIYSKYGSKTVLSHGKFDTWAFDGQKGITIPAIKAEVVNTIGCGDSMTAGLVDALLDNKPFKEAVHFGMQCATKRATHLHQGL